MTEQEEERLEIVGAQKLKERLPKFIMQEGTIPMYRWSEEYINQSINQSDDILLMVVVINRKKRWSSKHKKKPGEGKRNVWRKFRERSKRDWRGRRFTLVCFCVQTFAYLQIYSD